MPVQTPLFTGHAMKYRFCKSWRCVEQHLVDKNVRFFVTMHSLQTHEQHKGEVNLLESRIFWSSEAVVGNLNQMDFSRNSSDCIARRPPVTSNKMSYMHSLHKLSSLVAQSQRPRTGSVGFSPNSGVYFGTNDYRKVDVFQEILAEAKGASINKKHLCNHWYWYWAQTDNIYTLKEPEVQLCPIKLRSNFISWYFPSLSLWHYMSLQCIYKTLWIKALKPES